MALANLIGKADTGLVHLAAKHRIQAENHGPAFVREVFGVVEGLGNFILTLSAAEPVGVVPGEIAPNAEVIGGAELIVVVSQDGKQILELIAGALEASDRRLAIAVHQHGFPGSRGGPAAGRQHGAGRNIAGQRYLARRSRGAWTAGTRDAVRKNGPRDQRQFREAG